MMAGLITNQAHERRIIDHWDSIVNGWMAPTSRLSEESRNQTDETGSLSVQTFSEEDKGYFQKILMSCERVASVLEKFGLFFIDNPGPRVRRQTDV